MLSPSEEDNAATASVLVGVGLDEIERKEVAEKPEVAEKQDVAEKPEVTEKPEVAEKQEVQQQQTQEEEDDDDDDEGGGDGVKVNGEREREEETPLKEGNPLKEGEETCGADNLDVEEQKEMDVVSNPLETSQQFIQINENPLAEQPIELENKKENATEVKEKKKKVDSQQLRKDREDAVQETEERKEIREKGVVVWYNISKNYGYIECGNDSKIVVLLRDLKNSNALRRGQNVTFIKVNNPNSRVSQFKAVNVIAEKNLLQNKSKNEVVKMKEGVGTCAFYDQRKGYGFIASRDEKLSVYIHGDNIEGQSHLVPGQNVRYFIPDLGDDTKLSELHNQQTNNSPIKGRHVQRINAIKVKILSSKIQQASTPHTPSSHSSTPSTYFGVCTEWNDDKSYGFIRPDRKKSTTNLNAKAGVNVNGQPKISKCSAEKLFVHKSSLKNGKQNLFEGQEVTFQLANNLNRTDSQMRENSARFTRFPEAVNVTAEGIKQSKMITGTCRFFDVVKRFGFLAPNNSEDEGDIYFHGQQLNGIIHKGSQCTFNVIKTSRGNRAINVVVDLSSTSSHSTRNAPTIVSTSSASQQQQKQQQQQQTLPRPQKSSSIINPEISRPKAKAKEKQPQYIIRKVKTVSISTQTNFEDVNEEVSLQQKSVVDDSSSLLQQQDSNKPDRPAAQKRRQQSANKADKLASNNAHQLVINDSDQLASNKPSRSVARKRKKRASKKAEKLASAKPIKVASNKPDQLISNKADQLAPKNFIEPVSQKRNQLASNKPDQIASNKLNKPASNKTNKPVSNKINKPVSNKSNKSASNKVDPPASNKPHELTSNEPDQLAAVEPIVFVPNNNNNITGEFSETLANIQLHDEEQRKTEKATERAKVQERKIRNKRKRDRQKRVKIRRQQKMEKKRQQTAKDIDASDSDIDLDIGVNVDAEKGEVCDDESREPSSPKTTQKAKVKRKRRKGQKKQKKADEDLARTIDAQFPPKEAEKSNIGGIFSIFFS